MIPVKRGKKKAFKNRKHLSRKELFSRKTYFYVSMLQCIFRALFNLLKAILANQKKKKKN